MDHIYFNDDDLFLDNRQEYFSKYFTDFNDALNFCIVKYDISIQDFKKRFETNHV